MGNEMTKEVMVERQESLAPAPESAYLRAEVTRLREGNAAILRENAELRGQLANSQTAHIDTGHSLGAKCQELWDKLRAAQEWYDAEYPPEDGHDQVYPWDHA